MIRYLFSCTVLLITISLFPGLVEARQVGSYKSLSAHVADPFQCGRQVKLSIIAPDKSYFKGDRVDFQLLVGSARAALEFECDNIQSILIDGSVNKHTVYRGKSAAKNNWVIADRTSETIVQQDKAPQAQKIGPKEIFPRWAFSLPWTGKFRWDWNEVGRASLRKLRGKLVLASKADDKKYAFDLSFDTRIKGVCVSRLYETKRLSNGYIIKLETKKSENQNCDPSISHGFLLPARGGDSSYLIVLYNYSTVVASSRLKSSVPGFDLALDSEVADTAGNYLARLEEDALQKGRVRKTAAFKNSAEFKKIEPLFNSCMNSTKVRQRYRAIESYCQCIAQKFGLGGRIPGEEFALYSKDFSKLYKRMYESDADKLHNRLGRTCGGCGYAYNGSDLEPWCSGVDSYLYAGRNYQDMIRILEKYPEKLNATKYYKRCFFMDYLKAYSAHCGDNIRDPITFTYTVTEVKQYDPWGPEYENIFYQEETKVERKYAKKYLNCYNGVDSTSATVTDLMKGVNRTLKNRPSWRSTMRDTQNMMEAERAKGKALKDHLENRCGSASVRIVYKNLYDLVD